MTFSFITPSADAQAAHTQFISAWKTAAREKRVTAVDMVALTMHRAWWALETQAVSKEDLGAWIDARLDKAFTPVSNAVKLNNGAEPDYAKKQALFGLRLQLNHRERARQRGELDLPSKDQMQSAWGLPTALSVMVLLDVYKRQQEAKPATAARKVAP
jgi:hypothetical protein